MTTETFLSLDLDSLHVSSIILAVGPLLDDQRTKDRDSWMQRSFLLLENMISSGNLIACWRKQEMQQLDDMMNGILNIRTCAAHSEVPSSSTTLPSIFLGVNLALAQSPTPLPSLNMIGHGNGDDLSADQIMAIAGSIQDEDVEWMDRAIAENSIW